MSKPFRIIVTDTSPLFTLVLAGALDTLLRPGLPQDDREAARLFKLAAVGGAAGTQYNLGVFYE